MAQQQALFSQEGRFPDGLRYAEAFLSLEEEAALLRTLAGLDFRNATYHGYTAKRRTASFGFEYEFERNTLAPAAAIPEALEPMRRKAADWAGVAADSLAHLLVTEYQPGTPLGWHRDAPAFERVIGISLASACRMRFRPYHAGKSGGRAAFVLDLAPRSIYLLRGEARWRWQHSVSPTPALRYSITLRTLRTRGPVIGAPDAV